ncbi:hypothetical protein [Pseudoalteromonas denitrificans]|uniref:Uncharacterized protein n=1 Tax=Pseudoalteromonas denitrificans DSM 6059 TaxID=1123010 RepID=A0A1I1UXQ4_9GAMM|nr:hypothetical protein [Pseudoalteromonas denitrificans]SFD75464.1 hypothetical protein SAMN02745724_05363 [Pseudoalteromonas denitrificans DSM 6059]
MDLPTIYLVLIAIHSILAFIGCLYVAESIVLMPRQKYIFTTLSILLPVIGVCWAIDRAKDISKIRSNLNHGGLHFDNHEPNKNVNMDSNPSND